MNKTDETSKIVYNTKARRQIIAALEAVGGTVRDPSGRATQILLERTDTSTQMTAFSGTLLRMEQDGLIERKILGRRTYSIKLIQPDQDPCPRAEEPIQAPEPIKISVEQPEPPQQPQQPKDPALEPPAEPSVDTSVLDLPGLARQLLIEVADVLTNAPPESEVLRRRLGEALEGRLRAEKKLREAQDELVAVKEERDSLRQQKRSMEANIQAMLRGDTAESDRARKAIEKFMQARPMPGKAGS